MLRKAGGMLEKKIADRVDFWTGWVAGVCGGWSELWWVAGLKAEWFGEVVIQGVTGKSLGWIGGLWCREF